MLIHKKLYYFKRMYSYVDIILVCSNLLLCGLILREVWHLHDNNESKEESSQMETVRRAGVITTALLSVRMTYMLKIVDQVAPLIDIIGRIFYDIKYFMLVMFLFGIALANCFSLLANNQIDLDDLSDEEID